MNAIKLGFLLPLLAQIIFAMIALAPQAGRPSANQPDMPAQAPVETDTPLPAIELTAPSSTETPAPSISTDTETPVILPSDTATVTATEIATETPTDPGVGTDTPTPSATDTPTLLTETPVPPSTETWTVTPTPVFTETTTCEFPACATPTETVTPTGTPTDALASQSANLWLPIELLSPSAAPGKPFRFTWRLEGLNTLPAWDELELVFSLPAGFRPAPDTASFLDQPSTGSSLGADAFFLDPPEEFNAGNRELRLLLRRQDIESNSDGSLPSVFGWQTVLVDWRAKGPFMLHAVVQQPGVQYTYSDVGIDDAGRFAFGVKGGSAQGLGGQVEIKVPAGALTEPAILRIQPASPSAVTDPLFLEGGRFEVSVLRQENADPIYRFVKAAGLQVHYEDGSFLGEEDSLSIFRLDPTSGAWEAIPTTVDEAGNLLTAQIKGPGMYAFAPLDYLPARDFLEMPVANSGAAVFSIPLPLPDAGGTYKPSAELAYDSRMADTSDTLTQASWVGMGWRMEPSGYVERDLHGTPDFTGDDTFHLVMGPSRTMLLPGENGVFLSDGGALSSLIFDPSRNAWSGSDAAGNTFWFDDSSHQIAIPMHGACGEGAAVTWRWPLTSVQEPGGGYWRFEYETETKPARSNPGCPTDDARMGLAVHLRAILYPDGRRQVVFERAGRADFFPDWLSADRRVLFAQTRLNEMRVEEDRDGDGAMETIAARIVFLSESDPEKRVMAQVLWPARAGSQPDRGALTLAGIDRYGESGGLESMTRFTYASDRLIQVSDSAGATTQFEYETAPWYEVRSDGGYLLDCRSRILLESSSSDGGCYDVGQDLPDLRFLPLTPGGTSAFEWPWDWFRPGGAFRLRAYGYGKELRVGLAGISGPPAAADGDSGPLIAESFVVFSPGGAPSRLEIRGAQWELGQLEVSNLATAYRLVRKTVRTAGADPVVTVYRYDAPGTNEPSPAAEDTLPLLSYWRSWTRFLGNGSLTETGPDGVSRSTWFGGGPLRGMPARIFAMQRRYSDAFDTFVTAEWLSDGPEDSLQIRRLEGDPALRLSAAAEGPAEAALLRNAGIAAGSPDADTIAVQFKLEAGSASELGVAATGEEAMWVGIRAAPTERGLEFAVLQRAGGSEIELARPSLPSEALPGSSWVAVFRAESGGVRVLLWPVGDGQPALTVLAPLPEGAGGLDWRFQARTKGVLWLDEFAEGRLLSAEEFYYAAEELPLVRTGPASAYPQPAQYPPLSIDAFPFFDLVFYRIVPAGQRSLLP